MPEILIGVPPHIAETIQAIALLHEELKADPITDSGARDSH